MTLNAKALEAAKRAAAKALQAKYREIWTGSWPDTESAIELFDAAQAAYLSLSQAGGGEIDALAQEIRRVDGSNSLGAAQLAEALMPFLAALSSQQEEAVPAFDPMDGGCPHCEWLDTNLGRVLDQKCTLHQKIEDLQVNHQMERQVSKSINGVLRAVCEVIRADDDDDPVEVAKERMAEIEELESAEPAGEPGIKALEWCLHENSDPEYPRWDADGTDKRYSVFKAWWGKENRWAYVWDGFYHTEEVAKAAAQADYEARIRSALVTATSKAKGSE